MKRYVKRIFVLVLTLMTLVCMYSYQVSAVDGRISFSDQTVALGDTFTVTVSAAAASGIGAMDATLAYDTSLLEFVSGSGDGNATVSDKSGSIRLSFSSADCPDRVGFSLKFKSKAVGSAEVRAAHGEITSADEEVLRLGLGQSVVTIHPHGQTSSEARLHSLEVESGALSPSFNPDVYDYSVTVPSGAERLKVSLSTKSANARYSISGTKLSAGENTTTIVVTAEDGSTKTYTIHVTCPSGESKPEEQPKEMSEKQPEAPAEGDRIPVTVAGRTLYVGENLDGVAIPEGFEWTTVPYGNREVTAAVGQIKPLTLFWLVDEDGNNGAFYVQDALTGAFYPYVSLTTEQKVFTILPLADGVIPSAGYEESTVTIGEELYVCWRNSAAPESAFVLLYAMNGDGVTGFYRYDTEEGTMQRCAKDSIADTKYNAETFAQLKNDMKDKLSANESALQWSNLLVLLLIVVAALELIALLSQTISRKHRSTDSAHRCSSESSCAAHGPEAKSKPRVKAASKTEPEVEDDLEIILAEVALWENNDN